MTTKEFPTAAIASLSTGILLCPFDQMHAAAEFLMGRPIWTHPFADKNLNTSIRRTILEQYPTMPTELEGITRENYRARVEELEATFGASIEIRRGSGVTTMPPTDGIPDHLANKTIIIEV